MGTDRTDETDIETEYFYSGTGNGSGLKVNVKTDSSVFDLSSSNIPNNVNANGYSVDDILKLKTSNTQDTLVKVIKIYV